MFDSFDRLLELGPKIGLHFDNTRKNYFYVPVRFQEKIFKLLAEREVDRVIIVVTDGAAGAITVEAEPLEAEERKRAAAADEAMVEAN